MVQKHATLKDIAKETGFSIITISRVMSGRNINHVSLKTKEKVLACAKRLNYQPNMLARRLVSKTNNIVGVLIDSLAPPYYYNVLSHLESIIHEHNIRLQIGIMHNDYDAIERYAKDFLCSGVTDVICISHTYPEFGKEVARLMNSFKRVIFLEQPLAETKFPVVTSDHYYNHYEAVTELLKRSYRRIVTIRSDYRDSAYKESRRGVIQAYQDFGIVYDPDFWVSYSNENFSSEAWSQKMFDSMAKLKPDALIVASDLSAFRIIHKYQEQNAKIPFVFSSYLSEYGQYASPAISGLVYDTEKTSQKIKEFLLKDGEQESIVVKIPAKIIFY